MTSPGNDILKEMEEAGVSPEAMIEWETERRDEFSRNGVSPEGIDKYFGVQEPNFVEVDKDVENNLSATIAPTVEGGEPTDLSFIQSLEAGFQMSISGLSARQELPSLQLGAHEEIWDMVGFEIAKGIGDLPISVPAFIAAAVPGAGLGAAAGTAVFPGPGTIVGGIAGAGIGGGGASGLVTEGTRASLIKFYEQNEQGDPRSFLVRSASAVLNKETLKAAGEGGLIGAAVGGIGGVAKPLVKPIGNTIARGLIVGASETGAAVAAISAIEGELPTAETFAVAAGVILGFKVGEAGFVKTTEAGKKVQSRLKEHYIRTGETPDVAARRADNDPVFRQQILTGDDIITSDSSIADTTVDPRFSTIEGAPTSEKISVGVDGTVTPAEVPASLRAPRIREEHALEVDRAQTQAMEKVFGKQETILDIEPKITDRNKALADEVRVSGKWSKENSTKFSKFTPEEQAGFGTLFRQDTSPKRPHQGFKNVEALETAKADKVKAVKEQKSSWSKIVEASKPIQPKPDPKIKLGEDATPVQKANESILSNIDRTDKGNTTLREKVDDFRYEFINDLQYVVSAADEAHRLATGKRLPIEENPGELMRLAAGANAKAELAISRGIFDKNQNKIGDSLVEIMDRVGNVNEADFLAYIVSKRVIERTEKGFETGFDIKQAEISSKAGDANPSFVKEFDNIQTWANSMIPELVESGLISAKSGDNIIALSDNFVPLMRVMDGRISAAGVSTKGLPVRNPVKKFKGSDKKIINPLETFVKNRFITQSLADNNRARRRVVEFNNKLPDDQKIIVKAKKQTNVVKLAETDAELTSFLKDNGMDAADVTGVLVYRAATRQLSKGEFIVFEEGKPITYQALDPKLAASMQALDGATQSMLFKVLRIPSAAMRAGTVLTPDFMMRNLIRDNVSAPIINLFKVVPIYDAVLGMKAVVGKEKAWVKFIQDGGANSAILDLDRQLLSKGYFNKATWGTMPLTTAWNVATTPYRMLLGASMLLENATRIGANMRATQKGLPSEVAGLRARDVSLDFHRMGARVRAWNSISAFLGASINGIDRTIAAFKNDPIGTTAKASAMITIPSILLWWAEHDKPWYKELPAWKKFGFWNFEVDAGDGTPGSETIMSIPMPHVFGVFFGGIPVATLDKFIAENPDAMDGLTEELVKSFMLDPMPVAVTPFMEVQSNFSRFTKRPLVSQSQERNALPQYRYTDYTTQTAKELSRFTAEFSGGIIPDRFLTPIAMEHFVRSWSGTLGIEALKLVDKSLQEAGIVPERVDPAATLGDIPFVRGFFLRFPNSSAALDKFYDNASFIDQVKGSITKLEKEDRFDEVDKLLDKHGDLLLNTASTREAIRNLQLVIHGVMGDPDMAPDEKRQLIDEELFVIIEIARDFNDLFAEQKEIK